MCKSKKCVGNRLYENVTEYNFQEINVSKKLVYFVNQIKCDITLVDAFSRFKIKLFGSISFRPISINISLIFK